MRRRARGEEPHPRGPRPIVPRRFSGGGAEEEGEEGCGSSVRGGIGRGGDLGGSGRTLAEACNLPARPIGHNLPTMTTWRELMNGGGPIVADGAMGTMLMANGLEFGDPPELWNLEHPEIIRRVQRAYLDVGAQVLLTNTFGGNRLRLELHGREDRVDQLNRTAAVLARVEATAADHPAIVAGDIGPTGQIMEFDRRHAHARDRPRGVRPAGARARDRRRRRDVGRDHERRRGGGRGGPGRKGRCPGHAGHRHHELRYAWPDDDGCHPRASSRSAAGGGRRRRRRELRQRARGARPGHRADPGRVPGRDHRGQGQRRDAQLVGMAVHYETTPATMADFARQFVEAGANVVGACCGSTPPHLQAMAEALRT